VISEKQKDSRKQHQKQFRSHSVEEDRECGARISLFDSTPAYLRGFIVTAPVSNTANPLGACVKVFRSSLFMRLLVRDHVPPVVLVHIPVA
jgi:hypothetical protein